MAEDLDREARKARRREKRAAEAALQTAGLQRLDPFELLGDIDAWNLRAEDVWLRFDARLEDGPRAYLRPVAGGDTLADAPGDLMAIIGLGSPRRAGFNAGPPRFRYNILAARDHIGAVGLEGTDAAPRTAALQQLRHRSREALIADHLLARRYDQRRALPLIVTRVETDAACSIARLGQGPAFANFLTALDNLSDAAASLNRKPQVLAVTLGFGFEDLTTSATDFAASLRGLMAQITAAMRVRGMRPPIFLTDAESGTDQSAEHPALQGFQELSISPGPHHLILTTPAYAGAQEGYGRLTEAGRSDLAELDAYALDAALAGEDWLCPQPLLAEYDGCQIRVTFRAMADLVIDTADPHRAGPLAGFALQAAPEGCALLNVALAPDDPRALILTTSAPPIGATLLHAYGLAAQGDGLPINRSAMRDTWQAPAASGSMLNRWALPARLPLHPGAQHEL
ncbi:hypothetical protein Q9295_09375 [Xinfangfangia sp. CPCC 101601]|uniref:Uncharacterized protein n=1 Tax=Pseudogemmobacter lacusdianii TaxID=3069608 RepID=A0ABU0W0D8_9RHOB|nr:hypothetical protein [Xinfangfangia sp. CPCC 101601]MDQ2066585.1 hypothetical protein [Xinfangfangia sp. CPCC 101601]